MEALLSWLLKVVTQHLLLSYTVIFFASTFEGLAVTLVCGFLSAKGLISPIVVYPVIIAGDMLGDILHYGIGRYGGQPLMRYGSKLNKFGLNSSNFTKTKKYFETETLQAICIAKLFPWIGHALLILTGVVRLSFVKFMKQCLVVGLGESAILLGLGYLAGDSTYWLKHGYNLYALVVTVALILWLAVKFRKFLLSKFRLMLSGQQTIKLQTD